MSVICCNLCHWPAVGAGSSFREVSVLWSHPCGASGTRQRQCVPPCDGVASLAVRIGLSFSCHSGAFTYTYSQSFRFYADLNISVKKYADSCRNSVLPFFAHGVAAVPVVLTSEIGADSRV